MTEPALASVATALLLSFLAVPINAQNTDQLVPKNVSVTQINFKDRSAVQLVAKPDAPNGASYALVKNVSFETES
jgi:hypothetical protein